MVNAKLPATILQLILVDIKQRIDMEATQIVNKEREEYQKSVTEELQKNEATQQGCFFNLKMEVVIKDKPYRSCYQHRFSK